MNGVCGDPEDSSRGIALGNALGHNAPAMLIIDDLTVRIAGRTLIEDATARIPDGARVGPVGRNGTSKSTLFNAMPPS
jgi:ABC-type polysaccharide/polyol phosphate transport system ATPase subunit